MVVVVSLEVPVEWRRGGGDVGGPRTQSFSCDARCSRSFSRAELPWWDGSPVGPLHLGAGWGAARIDQLVSGAKVGRAHDSPRWWPRNVRLNRDPPAVVFIIREARATLAHPQYLLVAAFFLCRQPPCSLLSPTHHRINFALSNCDHLLYLSPLDWPNPSSSDAESISRHVASPNWESPPTTVPARTCDQPTRPSSPSSFVWPCDRNLSACLPPN